MKGYKVFNSDWKCLGFQYEVGKTYEMDATEIRLCNKGFHFCERIIDCFSYYGFDPENKIAEVEALGAILTDGKKSCTNKIKIVREMNWHEVLNLANIGKDCTGYGNTGSHNSGYWNTGLGNSGNCNSGIHNDGYYNNGSDNNGDSNSGNHNFGNWNSGSWNIGYRNTGNYNVGSRNCGDFNKTSNAVGCFNTQDRQLFFFDKPTDMTFDQWRVSKAYRLLSQCDLDPVIWIPLRHMTELEKQQHPESYTIGGYLKVRDTNDRFIEWWNNLTDEEKDIIKSIPNFDPDKFYKITGIRVEGVREWL
jgi:hypothetical protein